MPSGKLPSLGEQGWATCLFAVSLGLLPTVVCSAGGPAGFAAAEQQLAAPATKVAPTRAGIDARADVDGDGYSDLLVGGHHRVSSPTTWSPATWTLTVIFGSADGLTRRANQLWQESDFRTGPPTRGIPSSIATGDYNADGFDDVAIGTPEVETGPEDEAESGFGQIRVLYGSAQGLTTRGSQIWTQQLIGGPGGTGRTDEFGAELVAADFGRGRYDDLAISSSGWKEERGAVTVLYGSSVGLTRTGSQFWTQDSAGVPGKSATYDRFGSALAAGDLAGGRFAALAIGVPGNGGSATKEGSGAVNVLYGSANGLTAVGADLWSRASRGIKGRPAEYGLFGQTLAVGHFTGRTTADLAISDWSDESGAVHIIYGTSKGLTARGDQLWSPRSHGLPQRTLLSRDLGLTMTTGNFGWDRRGKTHDDLVMRVSSEHKGAVDTGAAVVLYGTAKGLNARHSQVWRWNSKGVKGNPARGDQDYGQAMTTADFGRGRFDDFAAADPLIGAGGGRHGMVSVLYGSPRGLTAANDQLWSVTSLGRTAPAFWADNIG